GWSMRCGRSASATVLRRPGLIMGGRSISEVKAPFASIGPVGYPRTSMAISFSLRRVLVARQSTLLSVAPRQVTSRRSPRRLSYSALCPIYRTMQDLNDLHYSVSVVDHGGFAAAGRTLGLQKSKLSRRILQLEERLGVRLLNRSSRRFSVTEIGREFYDRCLAMLVEAEAAEQDIAQVRSEPRRHVRISCPIALHNV